MCPGKLRKVRLQPGSELTDTGKFMSYAPLPQNQPILTLLVHLTSTKSVATRTERRCRHCFCVTLSSA